MKNFLVKQTDRYDYYSDGKTYNIVPRGSQAPTGGYKSALYILKMKGIALPNFTEALAKEYFKSKFYPNRNPQGVGLIASYRKSGMDYLPVIVNGKKRETIFGSPLATIATAKKFAQMEINERNRKTMKKNPQGDGVGNYSPTSPKIDLYIDGQYYASTNFYKKVKDAVKSVYFTLWDASEQADSVRKRFGISIRKRYDQGKDEYALINSKGKEVKVTGGKAAKKNPPRPRKYVTVIIGQGNYGSGWEDETSYLDDKAGREEAKADRKSYRENSQYPFRNIRRKVKIEDYEKGNF